MLDYYKNSEILDNDDRKYKKLIIGANVFFIVLCFIQIYHTFHTRGTSDFSYLWLGCAILANLFWIIYTFRNKIYENVATRFIFILFYLTIFVIKLFYYRL